MNFAGHILRFYRDLRAPENLPPGVDVLWPYSGSAVREALELFYRKFFSSGGERIFLLGINPGRFGAGVTGIAFTDPLRLSEDCGIPLVPGPAASGQGNSGSGAGPGRRRAPRKPARELSSDFIYRMIAAWGGPQAFYSHFYLGAMSPVGFLRDGKNLNYYDVKGLPEQLDSWMAKCMDCQLRAGGRRDVAFSLGTGTNSRYLSEFNRRHGFFKRVEALPHPRWVMQYRRKHLDEFIQLYTATLGKYL